MVDSAAAMRTEAAMAQSIEQLSGLDTQPNVVVSSFPFLLTYSTHLVPRLSVESKDVSDPLFGMMNVRTEAHGVEVSTEQLKNHDFAGAPAEWVGKTLRLDGVAMGTVFGMTDLDIMNPTDIFPTASPSTEVQFTGTPQGFKDPVSVIAELRIHKDTLRITPTTVVAAPEGREEEALAAFSWSIDRSELPLVGDFDRFFCGGGSIYIESKKYQVTLDPKEFDPRFGRSGSTPGR